MYSYLHIARSRSGIRFLRLKLSSTLLVVNYNSHPTIIIPTALSLKRKYTDNICIDFFVTRMEGVSEFKHKIV